MKDMPITRRLSYDSPNVQTIVLEADRLPHSVRKSRFSKIDAMLTKRPTCGARDDSLDRMDRQPVCAAVPASGAWWSDFRRDVEKAESRVFAARKT
jgi:hypothetical protein